MDIKHVKCSKNIFLRVRTFDRLENCEEKYDEGFGKKISFFYRLDK
jgi:hypothetical protein